MSKDRPIPADDSQFPSLSTAEPAGRLRTRQRERAVDVETPKQRTDRLNPSPSLRLLIILSFPLVLLLGVPHWWHTTSITRLPLPEGRIAALEEAPVSVTSSFESSASSGTGDNEVKVAGRICELASFEAKASAICGVRYLCQHMGTTDPSDYPSAKYNPLHRARRHIPPTSSRQGAV